MIHQAAPSTTLDDCSLHEQLVAAQVQLDLEITRLALDGLPRAFRGLLLIVLGTFCQGIASILG